jgi:hypothetical protein
MPLWSNLIDGHVHFKARRAADRPAITCRKGAKQEQESGAEESP